MTEKMNQIDKNNKHTEPAKISTAPKPMNTWKHMVAHVCIWFLVIALLMVYFTSTGSPQAGLLEVGVSAFIFVGLFHLVMKFFPLVTKIITSVIVIGFGMALIFVNYHYLKVVKRDASLKQLLVGDLLVHKILKTVKKEPIALVTKQEIRETILEPTDDKPSPTISLDQLKLLIADPVATDGNLESIRVTPLEPVMKTGTTTTIEKYQPGAHSGSTTEEVSRLAFIVKGHDPIVQHGTDRNELTTSPLLGGIREMSVLALQHLGIQPLLSETSGSIHMITVSEPFKELRIPTH